MGLGLEDKGFGLRNEPGRKTVRAAGERVGEGERERRGERDRGVWVPAMGMQHGSCCGTCPYTACPPVGKAVSPAQGCSNLHQQILTSKPYLLW